MLKKASKVVMAASFVALGLVGCAHNDGPKEANSNYAPPKYSGPRAPSSYQTPSDSDLAWVRWQRYNYKSAPY